MRHRIAATTLMAAGLWGPPDFLRKAGIRGAPKLALCQIAKMPDIRRENYDVAQENPPE
jgi:hypothetical protein